MSHYTTKADLKGETGVDTSYLAAKSDLASLKSEVDKLDVEKLKTVLVDLSKLRSLVNSEVVKKSVYDKLAAKVKSNLSKTNDIDTGGFVLKTKYFTDKSDLEKKS